MPDRPHILILGGGPAGVGAANRLRATGRADVTLLERNSAVGGTAASFEIDGNYVDFGSHRLHPACDPEILQDIRRLLGDELLERPRHGRIRLRGRWVHFPLKPLDLLLHLDPGFALGAARDTVTRLARGRQREADSFADVLLQKLGPTICESFYFPYARKLWGLAPEELSAEQAHRRVAANSPGKLVRKVLAQVPGFKAPGAGRFYYPRRGFGQITEAYAAEAEALGAELLLGWTATSASRSSNGDGWTVTASRDGAERRIESDVLWSTIPLTLLAQIVEPAPAGEVVAAAQALDYRAMILVYLELPVDRFTEYDAHYFPGEEVRITRLSETKVYADRDQPVGRTVVCAELPCHPDDAVWTASNDDLARLVEEDLARAGIPAPAAPSRVHVRRLRQAYPIYTRGFADPFAALDAWASRQPGLLSFGRQGLFAHDNTHHALAMAYAATDCVSPAGFVEERWGAYRREFEKHVVVD
jgi:protoporphyrinogen oxidase